MLVSKSQYNTFVPVLVLMWYSALACVASGIEPRAALAALQNGSLASRTELARVEQADLVAVWPDAAHALVLFRNAEPLLVAFSRTSGAHGARCPAAEVPGLAQVRLPAIARLDSAMFLDVYQRAGAAGSVEPVVTLDAAGVRIADRLLLFPREADHPRSVFFDAAGGESLEFLLTGMSGGTWEVWRDGFLAIADLPALPGGTLRFEGPPGGYFLRRR